MFRLGLGRKQLFGFHQNLKRDFLLWDNVFLSLVCDPEPRWKYSFDVVWSQNASTKVSNGCAMVAWGKTSKQKCRANPSLKKNAMRPQKPSSVQEKIETL